MIPILFLLLKNILSSDDTSSSQGIGHFLVSKSNDVCFFKIVEPSLESFKIQYLIHNPEQITSNGPSLVMGVYHEDSKKLIKTFTLKHKSVLTFNPETQGNHIICISALNNPQKVQFKVSVLFADSYTDGEFLDDDDSSTLANKENVSKLRISLLNMAEKMNSLTTRALKQSNELEKSLETSMANHRKVVLMGIFGLTVLILTGLMELVLVKKTIDKKKVE